MNWFKSDYTRSLEAHVTRLQAMVDERDKRIADLTERLLLMNRVPETPEVAHRRSLEAQEQLEARSNIFEDLEGGVDDSEMDILNPVTELVQDKVLK